MCPVRYEVGFYIPEDVILHSHRHETLKPYIVWNRTAYLRVNMVRRWFTEEVYILLRVLSFSV
jgi:hypothetical protein